MDNVLLRYSDFFDDDGGFDKVKKDFDELGDDLIKKAKDVRSKIKLFDLDDVDGIKEAEKQTEDLSKVFKKVSDAKEQAAKIEKEYQKQIKKTNQTNDDQLDKLAKLDKQLQEHRTNLKELNKLGTINGQKIDDVNRARAEEQVAIKQVSKEIRDHQKEILKSNELSRKEQKLIEAKVILQKEEIKTLDDVRERMSALRRVVQSLDLESQADQIAAYNDEINELTDILSENSDKFIQSKINVGNYEESIVSALKGTGLFTTNIGALDDALNSILGILTKSADEVAEMEENMDGAGGAVQRFTVRFAKLNKVLKASIIGAILIAVAALGSAFGDTVAGSIRMEKAMLSLKSILSTLGQVAQQTVKAIALAFEVFSNPLNFANSALREQVKKEFAAIVDIVESGSDAIVKGMENIERALQIDFNIKRLKNELAELNGELQIFQSIADDSTKSLSTQLIANQRALQLAQKIGQKNVEIQEMELEVINEKVKQNILANGVEADNIDLSQKGIGFAQAVLDLAKQRGVQLEISKDLIDQQQAAVTELINSENELSLTVEENGKKRREIQRDIFEQNLDLLIDLIDTEKNLSEQYVNDVTKNFQNRLNEFNRFLVVFRENSQRELDEFTKEASNLGLDLDFSIEYDENGDFKVFAGDTELATDNIVALNKQLQDLGLNEIDINRFREFLVETRNGVRDFRDLAKEIKLVGINVKELRANLEVSEDELKALDELDQRLRDLNNQVAGNIPGEQRKALTKQIEEIEKERTEIEQRYQNERDQNRIAAIDAELKTVEEGSERYFELLQERIDLEKQLREQSIDNVLDKTKDANKKALEDYEKFGNEVRRVLDAVADKAVEVARKRVDAAEKAVDKQNELVSLQQSRAQAGLENTLAFEQRELAKREAERIKQEKRQERLEKIRALYSSYANYSSRGDKNPIVKALRDFAILEAITASFGDGGIVEDKIADKNRGIIRGRSHQGRQGGIPVLVEGKEGIFSSREMENLGKENFYAMKDLASMGKVDSNFFSRQREAFIQKVPVGTYDGRVVEKLTRLEHAIQNIPGTKYDVQGMADGTIEVIETIMKKNHTKRNIYKTKRPGL